jgi:hypothetical protein
MSPSRPVDTGGGQFGGKHVRSGRRAFLRRRYHVRVRPSGRKDLQTPILIAVALVIGAPMLMAASPDPSVWMLAGLTFVLGYVAGRRSG